MTFKKIKGGNARLALPTKYMGLSKSGDSTQLWYQIFTEVEIGKQPTRYMWIVDITVRASVDPWDLAIVVDYYPVSAVVTIAVIHCACTSMLCTHCVQNN